MSSVTEDIMFDESHETPETTAFIRTGPSRPSMSATAQQFEWLVMSWAWRSRFSNWTAAMRVLAAAMHTLEDAGLIARDRKVRGSARVARLTDAGQRLLALRGVVGGRHDDDDDARGRS
jgi:hypothetical protein